MVITYDQYAAYLLNWCEYRGNEFRYYFPLKWGWEAWVQADYAAFVLRQDSTVDILREESIYTDPYQRVDLLINNNAPAVPQKIAIEIKCQTFLGRNTFVNGIASDISKLAQNKISTPYFRGCQTGVLGLYFTEEARVWMRANNFIEIYSNTNVACGIRKLN